MLVEITPDRPGLKVELEAARNIRNGSRHFMTNNTKMITEREQQEWYNSLDHDKLRLFLYIYDNRPVGYGIINKQHTPFALLTGAVMETYRGRGIGKDLFQSLIDLTDDDPFVPELDVRSDNTRAIKLYESLGFVKTVEDKDIISMIRPR
jgi:ribosomal protein S18 acetylase RimI-like enzyme